MQLFYTGAQFVGEPQQDPEKSLGGKLSGSVIPNDRLMNIFSDISELSKSVKSIDTKGVMLKNTLTVDVTNVKMYYDLPADTIVKIEIAAVSLVGNEMESINSPKDTPYFATFFEAEGIANEVTLVASLPQGEAIGLWIRRSVLGNPLEGLDCPELKDALENQTTEETVPFTFTYDTP